MKRTLFPLLAALVTFTVTAQDASILKPVDGAGLFERLAFLKAAAEDRAAMATNGVTKPEDKVRFYEHYNIVRRDCDMAIGGLIGALRSRGAKPKHLRALDSEMRSGTMVTRKSAQAAVARAEEGLKAFYQQPVETAPAKPTPAAIAATDLPDLLSPIIDTFKWAKEQQKARIDELVTYLDSLRLKDYSSLLPKGE